MSQVVRSYKCRSQSGWWSWKILVIGVIALAVSADLARAEILDKQRLLDSETFWDNQDWEWYKQNIPFFESPESQINTTYYYRWELMTKHLVYGSPNSGYAFTEFIDRPFWSGTFGAISCPAGHQLYDARWLRTKTVAQDYSAYWLHTPGAQPRRYSTWLADAVWAAHQVHPDERFTTGLLDALIENHRGWEATNFVPDIGLFWQTGHDDGMEININSRQTTDEVRGAPAYRPTLNSYLWADALAIARIARLRGDEKTAQAFEQQAASIKRLLQEKLWDPQRQFFFPLAKQEEIKNGHRVAPLSLTHQTGQFAGSPHGRELIGYVPWQFGLPDRGYEGAWKFLMDPNYFRAAYGPTVTERNDPLFLISKHCCVWSGQSWPYATSQTLKAMARLLQEYDQKIVTRNDYLELLRTFAKTHTKDGRPYLAEAANPDTGSWEGHDAYNHSEHYFHSSFVDLIITGLVGVRPRDDNQLELQPLAPDTWDYFALDDLPYRGHRIGIFWDRTGNRYNLGPGLHVRVDNRLVVSQANLDKLVIELPQPLEQSREATAAQSHDQRRVNFAVNNDGAYYPRVKASYTAAGTSTSKLIDGNYWYHAAPPNRWTCAGSTLPNDWCEIDLGITRTIDEIALYFLHDGPEANPRSVPPRSYQVRYWDGKEWVTLPVDDQQLSAAGRRANRLRFSPLTTSRLRFEFEHHADGQSGLTEIEAWGWASLPVSAAPEPVGNIAYNDGKQEFPKATASHTSRFDDIRMVNDGKTSFLPSPHNRWTSYESKSATDWVEIDFGKLQEIARVELAIFDDRGGVQAPEQYVVEFYDGTAWRKVTERSRSPERPIGGQFNEVTFNRVSTSKIRVTCQHRGESRSGISEILVWNE